MISTRALAREVIRLAWPVVFSGLATTAVLFTDRLMLGRYSAETLGSMQISGPLVWSLFSIFGAYAVGAMAVLGRAVGAGRVAHARRTLAAVLGLALAVGLVLGAAGFAGREAIASLVAGSAPETAAIRALAVTYLGIVLPFSAASLVGTAGVVALTAAGDTRTPMQISVAAGLSNLAVSYVLIFGVWGAPELGIAGAAIGTATSMVLFLVFSLAALVRGSGSMQLTRAGMREASLATLGPVLSVATPAFGEKVVFHAGYMVFVGLVGRLGEVAMASHVALIAIESLGFIATSAFGVAASALVAQRMGAGEVEAAARAGWMAAGIAVAALCGVSVLFVSVPERLVGLFLEEPEMVALGAQCLMVAAVAQPLMAVTDALAGALRGAGDTRTPMVVALAGPVAVRIAACWFLAFELELGLLGIWLGSTLDWLVRAVWLAIVYARGRWKTIEL